MEITDKTTIGEIRELIGKERYHIIGDVDNKSLRMFTISEVDLSVGKNGGINRVCFVDRRGARVSIDQCFDDQRIAIEQLWAVSND